MEAITFGDNLPGFIIGDVTNPAVIVIQEWWGVTPNIKEFATKIAASGYRCLIPDLYKGKIGVDKEEAQHLSSNLNFKQAVQEIKQAADYLRANGAQKIGAIGFCMGGALAVAAAQHAGIQCAAPFYGLPPADIAQPDNVKVPVQMHTGEQDNHKGFSDPDSVRAYGDKIKAAGGQAEVFVYPNCGHGFLNADKDAAAKRKLIGAIEPPKEMQELAWSRIFAFFEQQLKN